MLEFQKMFMFHLRNKLRENDHKHNHISRLSWHTWLTNDTCVFEFHIHPRRDTLLIVKQGWNNYGILVCRHNNTSPPYSHKHCRYHIYENLLQDHIRWCLLDKETLSNPGGTCIYQAKYIYHHYHIPVHKQLKLKINQMVKKLEPHKFI